MIDIDPFIAEFARLRQERGWSPNELGRRAGIAGRTIAMLEAGRNGPTLYTIRAIAAAFDLGVQLGPAETRQDRRRRQWRECKQRQRAVDKAVEGPGPQRADEQDAA